MSKHPSIVEYRRAIADPKSAFIDDFLANGEVKKDGVGLPQMSSGGFACLATVRADAENTWVVRFFTKPQSDLPSRYRAVVEQTPRDCLLEAYYLEDGVFVSGYSETLPIVIIRFAEGLTLRNFLINACRRENRKAIVELRDSFDSMKFDLRDCKLIHGDLSPDNLIVQGRQTLRIKLVDYDNCWHPSCGNLKSNVGKNALQRRHSPPFMDSTYDDFSFAIYAGVLELLAMQPGWGVEDDLFEQQLLISLEDLDHPESSRLLCELKEMAPTSYEQILDLYNTEK